MIPKIRGPGELNEKKMGQAVEERKRTSKQLRDKTVDLGLAKRLLRKRENYLRFVCGMTRKDRRRASTKN